MEIGEIVNIMSALAAVVGLAFGYYEHKRRLRTQAVTRTYLTSIINRVRSSVSYKTELEALLAEGSDPSKLERWVWVEWKAISDLYVGVVTYYLSLETEFSHSYVNRLIEAGAIQTAWEERIWRDLVALRPENRAENGSERIIKDNSGREAW